jgi:hypothetical protein
VGKTAFRVSSIIPPTPPVASGREGAHWKNGSRGIRVSSTLHLVIVRMGLGPSAFIARRDEIGQEDSQALVLRPIVAVTPLTSDCIYPSATVTDHYVSADSL